MNDFPEEDRSLVTQAKAGDFTAFEALVTKYERRLYNLALRILRREHDAEEVVQQTFLSVIEHLNGFREESAFYTWVARIATNHALAMLRKQKTRAAVTLVDDHSEDSYSDVQHPEFVAQWRETPDEIASRRETRQLLLEALDELDEKYRLVFLLRDVEGLSTAETAESLGISQSNVKVRLLRARLMLRERLTRVFGDEATRVTPGHDHE
jgi:RNA polymerase sigma-70 factor (ECF subfamily)